VWFFHGHVVVCHRLPLRPAISAAMVKFITSPSQFLTMKARRRHLSTAAVDHLVRVAGGKTCPGKRIEPAVADIAGVRRLVEPPPEISTLPGFQRGGARGCAPRRGAGYPRAQPQAVKTFFSTVSAPLMLFLRTPSPLVRLRFGSVRQPTLSA
jgi:hypothetical protein